MSLNSSDRNGWITDEFYKEQIIFHEFHTFDSMKYIGDAAARAYIATSRIYRKPMLLRPIVFNQSYTIQNFVNEVNFLSFFFCASLVYIIERLIISLFQVKQHRKVELHDNILRFYGVTKEGTSA